MDLPSSFAVRRVLVRARQWSLHCVRARWQHAIPGFLSHKAVSIGIKSPAPLVCPRLCRLAHQLPV
jgi:hypothetical protein